MKLARLLSPLAATILLVLGSATVHAQNAGFAPAYSNSKSLGALGELMSAGKGPYAFSIESALSALGGYQFARDEVNALRHRFGQAKLSEWEDMFRFAMSDTSLQAKVDTGSLPHFDPYTGLIIGKRIVDAGRVSKDGFDIDTLLGESVSPEIHAQVAADIDSKYGDGSYDDFKTITDRAMNDLAQDLKNPNLRFDPQFNPSVDRDYGFRNRG